MSAGRGAHRIGEFARRVGVSSEVLRAWEQRCGLLRPIRSAGGFRLYTGEDANRIARMRRALADGMSAAEAARVGLEADAPARGLIEDAQARLWDRGAGLGPDGASRPGYEADQRGVSQR